MRIGRALPVLFLVVLGGTAGPAEGHAQYVLSTPPAGSILATPPGWVNITFTEAVVLGSPSIRVINASGAPFGAESVGVSPDNPRAITGTLSAIGPGIYTVTWTAVSADDGHFSAGTFSFAVQNPDGTVPCCFDGSGGETGDQRVSALEVAGRFLSFLGLTITVGAAALLVFAWAPGVRDAASIPASQHDLGLRILAHWGGVGALTLAVGATLWWSTVGFPLSATPFTASLAARLVSGLALLGVFSAIARTKGPSVPGHVPNAAWVALGVGGFALAGASLGTHAAADSGLLGAAFDGLHTASVAAWVGGLLALARLRPFLRNDENVAVARHVYGRFSRLAFYAVGGVLLGGVGMTLLLVESLDRLVGSIYGWVILTKVGLFGSMVTLGAINRYRFLPAAAGSGEAPSKAVRDLTGNIRREVALGACVLLAAALLTALVPPPTSAGAATFELEATEGDVRFEFQMFPYPKTPGVYTYSLLVWNATTGGEYLNARNANLTFTLLNSGPGRQTLQLGGPHGNHFFSDSPALSQAGTWKIDVLLTRPSDFLQVTFHVVIREG